MAFVKLHATILDSSVWHQSHSIVKVWIAMMALADENGVVHLSAFGLQKRAAVSRPELDEAIAYLEAPDVDSRDKSNEGRRIEPIDGGWFLFNHGQYRDRQTDAQISGAARAKRFRDKRRASVTRNKVTPRHAASRDIPLEAEADKSQNSEAELTTSEPLARPTESVLSQIAPCDPPPPLRPEDTTAVAKAPQDGTSQASVAVAVPRPTYIPEAYEAASYLFAAIRSHSPTFLGGKSRAQIEKKLTGWTKHLDWLIRLDEKPLAEVKRVIDYCHRSDDTFNRGTVQSGQKLRKRFEELSTRASPQNHRPRPGQRPMPNYDTDPEAYAAAKARIAEQTQ